MFKNLKTVDVSKTQYIKEGVHKVTVTKIESSQASNPNANTPYIDFHMKAEDGAIGKARIFGDKEGQSEKAADYKAKMLKELLIAGGVTNFDDYIVACKQTVGKTFYAVFATREYWNNDSDGNPVIRKVVDYKWPCTENTPFEDKWNRVLTPDELRAYTEAKKMSGVAGATAAVDDLPF